MYINKLSSKIHTCIQRCQQEGEFQPLTHQKVCVIKSISHQCIFVLTKAQTVQPLPHALDFVTISCDT